MHESNVAVRIDFVVTYRTTDRVPVVNFTGHFVLVPGLVQATGIKDSYRS